jgi:hypothetical protein
MRQSSWGLVALVACLLLLAPLAGASNSTTYADATADAPAAAPDLTAVEVSNDDAGNVFFRITIPNRAALEDSDFVAVLLDTDRKQHTGCAGGTFGAEYALDVLSRRFIFGRCSRGVWTFTKKAASFGGSFAHSTLTLRANRRDLGGANALQFRVGAATTATSDPAYDFAPDIGTSAWSYKIVAPPQAVKQPPKRKAMACKKRRAHRCAPRRAKLS